MPGKLNNRSPMNWWADDLDVPIYEAATSALYAIQTLQDSRLAAGALYEALYEQRNAFSADSGTLAGDASVGFGFIPVDQEIGLITYNAMQIGFDTLVSKLMQADPQAKFSTDNESFETQKKAEILERIVRTEFEKISYYDVKEEVALDMLIFGFGEMRFDLDEDEKAVKIRRVHSLDVFYDTLEARDMPPITRYETTLVTKDSLKEEYPEFTQEIDAANIGIQRSTYTMRGIDPDAMVQLCEGIRRPVIKGGKPGKRILFISTACLHEEEWDRDFPVVRFQWTKKRRGPYPLSAAEQIVFLQRNLNRQIQRQNECVYELAAPRIILDENSNVPPSHFKTSGVGDIIQGNFTGRPAPIIMNPSVVPQDVVALIQQTKQDISNILGLNALESVGDKPTGLDTQPGLSEYTTQAGLRHYKTIKENDRFVVESAKKLLETLRIACKKWGKYAVLTEAMGEYEQIDFSDADLPPSALRISIQPANLLPTEPAGRLQRVTQLAQTGAFTPKQVIRMFQSPDMMDITNEATAGEQEVEWSIYHMTKEKKPIYYAPTEHTDFELAIPKVNAAWERCRRQGYPDVAMQNLDRWLAEAISLQEKQQAAIQARMMAQQAMQAQAQNPNQPGQSSSTALSGQAPAGAMPAGLQTAGQPQG